MAQVTQQYLSYIDQIRHHNLELAAQEQHADLVLIDEKLGRNVAEYLGLSVSGTLGVLLKAKRENIIPSFMQAANSMREQGIFFHPKLIERWPRSCACCSVSHS